MMTTEQSTSQQRMILTTAHIFIGLGLIFIHVFHTSSVFEASTNFSKLNRLERQMQFRHEDAFYLYVYHTIAEAKDFRTGLEEILRNNFTEYPNTVNGIKRFSILPEILIAYLYKQFIQLTSYYNIPTVSCWERVPRQLPHAIDGEIINSVDDIPDDDDIIYRHHLYYYYDQHNNVICDGPGLPIFFYLEIVWYLGGLSVFTLYIFATYLSHHILGGLCAVIYYFCIHNDATRIQTNPVARDNFAFPFIFGQMYFLTVWIEQHNRRCNNIEERIRQSNLGAQADGNVDDSNADESKNLLRMECNELKLGFFTAFAILAWDFSAYIFASQIVIVVLMAQWRLLKRRNIFLQNFILAHIMARIFTNMIKFGWSEFHQKSMTFDSTALITLFLFISIKYPTKKQRQRKIERIILRILLFIMAVLCLIELFSNKSLFSHYTDVILSKIYVKNPTFSTMLHLCRLDYGTIDSATLTAYNCLFLSKFFVVFTITWSANWLYKRRQIQEDHTDRIQRAKNYLLEDYFEENKMSMADLANIERNKEIQKCMELLKKLNYDYDRYKSERRRLAAKAARDRPQSERDAFLNEVKKFKNEISEKDNLNSNTKSVHEMNSDLDNGSSSQATNTQSKSDEDKNGEEQSKDQSNDTERANWSDWRSLLIVERPHYFYNLMQTAVLILLTVLLLKVKYVLTPCLCLIASTFPLKKWLPKSYCLWTIYLIIIGSCMMDRGVQNIRQQYQPKDPGNTSENLEENNLYEMLKWIKANTDRNAVFAGPEDIITTVLLTTGRPIVNHPLNEHPEMRKRTKIIHSILSKQDSNTVYNQLASLKIDYIIVSHRECFVGSDSCKISHIWDIIQPEYQTNIQLCAELFQRTNLNFLRVFLNENYMILKIFERFQIDLNFIELKLQEKNI